MDCQQTPQSQHSNERENKLMTS